MQKKEIKSEESIERNLGTINIWTSTIIENYKFLLIN